MSDEFRTTDGIRVETRLEGILVGKDSTGTLLGSSCWVLLGSRGELWGLLFGVALSLGPAPAFESSCDSCLLRFCPTRSRERFRLRGVREEVILGAPGAATSRDRRLLSLGVRLGEFAARRNGRELRRCSVGCSPSSDDFSPSFTG